MFKKTVLVAAVFVVLFSSNLYAQSFSLGLKGSTLGVGVEVEGNINKTFGGRIGANYLKYTYDGTVDDIDYEHEIKSTNFPVLLDWHPFSGSFRISGGVVFANSKFEASASYSATDDELEKIGDIEYKKSDIGNLEATVAFTKTNPYLGLGWDTSFGESKRFGFLCDLGVVFQGAPKVDLSSRGQLASDATFQSELAKEEKDMQDDLDKFRYYPVLAIGVSYRF